MRRIQNAKELGILLLSLALIFSVKGQDVVASDDNSRRVAIVEDRDQTYMTSKLYELKNVKGADLAPFVLGAVRRFNTRGTPEASVQSLAYAKEGKEYILVNMATDIVALIDDMIAKLDRPSKTDGEGSIVDGDGIYRFVYCPKHRFTKDMINVASIVSGGDGQFFSDPSTNMFYWKDSKSDGD
ncbi:MAG TPA: hypothetical protein PK821_01865, partial [Victivallales bacterium]|nr:hypothetical protein [Victivallales bacterium]